MLQHGGLPQLLQLLKQPNPAVKDAVYGALCAAARFEVLRTALMQEQGAMRQLLGHVQQEEPGRAAQALELLVHCTQVGRLFLQHVTAAIASTATPSAAALQRGLMRQSGCHTWMHVLCQAYSSVTCGAQGIRCCAA
jgi:hypothetical protein